VKKRWLPVGLLALGIFAVNAIARLVTRLGEIVEPTELDTIGIIASASVGVILIGAAAWWAVRYPFSRVFFDIGGAVLVGALLSLLVGPFIGGSTPFAEGPGLFVGQFLLFLGIAAVGFFLGFLGMVALGKDWKSRGLRRYEQNYQKRPRRTVRG